MLPNPRATVIVCTRDRARDLAATLEAALALETALSWELVVVDNGSCDGTLELARAWADRHPERMRLVSEPVAGLSAARNCGLRHARGDWVAFLDDDALPAAGWIDAYDAALAEPGVLSAGGPVDPLFDGELPAWLEARYLPYLSVWDRGPEALDLSYPELPRGANVAYRREAFELVGEFDRRLGRAGRSLRSCEEIELGLRLERCGARTRYAPRARVRHRVAAARLTPAWLEQRFWMQGFSEAIVDWKHLGARGLRHGWRRRRLEVERLRADAGDALWFRCVRRDLDGYARGAGYALLAVERWEPPPETASLPGPRRTRS